jgi:hypothetical protein
MRDMAELNQQLLGALFLPRLCLGWRCICV